MDFLVRKAEGSAVKIQTDIYLTNEGLSTSENYRMLIKAREMDTHLIADKIWTSTGSFAPDATVIRSVNLTVPDNYNYVVEVLLWDGDTIIKRGEDYVQLNPMIEIDKDTELKTRYVDTEDFIVDEPVEEMDYNEKPETDMATPGFSGLLAVCSLLIAIAIIRRNQDE
jgi:hypothetical protein